MTSKDEITDAAWEGFISKHSLDNIINEAPDQDEAFEAVWKLGFYYALLSIEKGIVIMQRVESPSNN